MVLFKQSYFQNQSKVPGEFTTMAGRILRDHLKEIIRSYEPETDPVITIAGLSNLYTHYITTPEEYDAQFRIKSIIFHIITSSYYYVMKLNKSIYRDMKPLRRFMAEILLASI